MDFYDGLRDGCAVVARVLGVRLRSWAVSGVRAVGAIGVGGAGGRAVGEVLQQLPQCLQVGRSHRPQPCFAVLDAYLGLGDHQVE